MGATKVYAAARNPESLTLNGVVPLKLDVTSDEDAVAAARVVIARVFSHHVAASLEAGMLVTVLGNFETTAPDRSSSLQQKAR